MGVCESENNTKETNIPSGSQAKIPIKDETMIKGQPIIEIEHALQIYQKLYASYKLQVHQVQDF